MKIEVCVSETSYGTVIVEVPEDATEIDIANAAKASVENGDARWNKSKITVGAYEGIE